MRASRLSRWASFPILLLLLACVSSAPAVADDASDSASLPTYRSTVSEVRVTFFATDENNRPLDTLKKSDFVVVDSDRLVRNFRSFARAGTTPLDVVVLVDLSESVAPRWRATVSDVLQLVAQEQSFPNDDISVLCFGGSFVGKYGKTSGDMRPAVLCAIVCPTSDLEARLQTARSGGITPLFDALLFANDFIASHRRANHRREGIRPVLILFSDGNDTVSLHSERDARQAARDAGALIYAVDIGASGKRAPIQTAGNVFLRQVSDATGGRYFSPRFSVNDGTASMLNTVLEDLRASYVVTYDLPNHEAGFHSIRLCPTHNLNLTFHSRDGYNYEPGGR
ncbi:MAG: VWA domain-containing protein [Terriglobales bacterium]